MASFRIRRVAIAELLNGNDRPRMPRGRLRVLQSGTARVLIRCADNLFFAVSPGNFTIVGSDPLFADGFE